MATHAHTHNNNKKTGTQDTHTHTAVAILSGDTSLVRAVSYGTAVCTAVRAAIHKQTSSLPCRARPRPSPGPPRARLPHPTPCQIVCADVVSYHIISWVSGGEHEKHKGRVELRRAVHLSGGGHQRANEKNSPQAPTSEQTPRPFGCQHI